MTRIVINCIAAIVLTIIGTLAIGAHAQTKPVSALPEAPSLAEKVEILTKARTAIDVPLNEPRAIDLSLLNVPGIERTLTDGVTAKGYTRYVDVNSKKIGQVVLVGVEKNGRQEALNSTDFTAQFDMAKPQLDPAADVLVKGDRAQLRVALEKLAAAKQEEKREEPAKATQQAAAPQSNSGQRQNDLAGNYQTPSAVSVAPAPEESVRVSSDGCPIRVDLAQLRAVQQNKSITSKGGTVQSETECSDSSKGFPLLRSYSVCSDQIDLEARKSQARFKLYYVDEGGATKEVTDCTPDSDKIFPIVEKYDSCTVSLDYVGKLATPRATLVYMDASNREVQVRGCEASEAKPAVQLVATTNGCSIRHDFANSKSFQQGTHHYTLEGVTYQAGACADNGTEYPQTKVYTDAGGAYICQPVIDQNASTVALQSRLRITVGSLSQFITDCTPDTSTLAVQSTTDGCTDPSLWQHDMAAARSYGQERFFFLDNGSRKYLGQCQNSQSVYVHKVQITGYQNHDGQLYSFAQTTVYIEPLSGRFDIKVSEVLPGAVQIPYELQGTSTALTGTSTYQGCDALRETNKVEQWKRPDNTIYNKIIGAGTPVGPVDVCVTTLIDNRRLTTGYSYQLFHTVGDSNQQDYWYQRMWVTGLIQKHQLKNTETGQIVGNTCSFDSGGWYSGNGAIMDSQQLNWHWTNIGAPGPAVQQMFLPPCPY
ncbi:MAG: hypothetical protein ACK4FJ_16975 [Ferrovibrio sp.]|uniref:hypothetical protein n=1 Tax=Ferrovibrio sp. TaxID=1917215 RepID=UPI003919040B